MDNMGIQENVNVGGNVQKKTPQGAISKDSSTKVPTKPLTHADAKHNAKITGAKIPFNKAMSTDSGVSGLASS
jgi:hypothetical protein